MIYKAPKSERTESGRVNRITARKLTTTYISQPQFTDAQTISCTESNIICQI